MKRILFKNSDHHATLPTDVDLIQKPSGVDSREAAILFLSAAIGREYYSGLDAKNRLQMISDIAHELGNHYPHVVNDFQINNIRSQLAVNNEVILFIGKVRDEIIQNTDKDGQGYDLISKSVKNSAQRERDKALEKREAIAKAQQKMDDRAVVDKYLKPESIEAAQKSDRIGFDSNVATLAKFLREGKTDRTALKAFGLNKAERIEVRHKVETELAELKLLERTTSLREPQPESFAAGAVQSKANGTGWTQGA